MHPSTLKQYEWLVVQGRGQHAHQLAKRTFNMYPYQLSECKFLLRKFIELPIIFLSSAGSIVQPARHLMIRERCLVLAFEDHKNTPEYQDAVKRSQTVHACRQRLNRNIWWAK